MRRALSATLATLAMATIVVAAAACADDRRVAAGARVVEAQRSAALDADEPAVLLSPTRLLRKLHLTVRGAEPSLAEYEAATAAFAAGADAFDAFYAQQVGDALASPEFYEQMLAFGADVLRVGDYTRGTAEGIVGSDWKGSQAIELHPCDDGTLHAGVLGHFTRTGSPTHGDLRAICDDASATIASVEPWWAPGTTVEVIGRAGDPRQANSAGTDCGAVYMADSGVNFPDDECGCGPNLLYCMDRPLFGDPQYPQQVDASPFFEGAQRRMLFEEPARLFAHVVVNDLPYADLVTGTTTVAPRRLQFMYARWGRMNEDNAAFDASTWWRAATDAWDPVEIPSIQPNLLAARDTSFDPRIDDGAPAGIPAAGVLTMLGPNVFYPRERVRAARFLEIFACRQFTAPDPSIPFSPPYSNDPARQGSCQHCHTLIDPTAIHFKRLEVEEDRPRHGLGFINLGGIGSFQWRRSGRVSFADENSPSGEFWYEPYGRWNVAFIPDTFLTPVTAERIVANDDARFLDFLPPGETLFGIEGDGTIGPLGFGKLLVASGELDTCAVKRVFERVMGRPLSVESEGARERALVDAFLANDRAVRPLMRALLLDDDFRRGL